MFITLHAYLTADSNRPVHVVKLANEAIDPCRRRAWNQEGRTGTSPRWVKHTRRALVKDPGQLSTDQRLTLEQLRGGRSVLWRGWR